MASDPHAESGGLGTWNTLKYNLRVRRVVYAYIKVTKLTTTKFRNMAQLYQTNQRALGTFLWYLKQLTYHV